MSEMTNAMTQEVNFVNVRYGTMDDNGQCWAHVHIIEDEFIIRDGFAGQELGKVNLSTADGNKLAKTLHSAIAGGEVVPGPLKLQFALQFSLKGSKPTVVGFIPNNAKLPRAEAIAKASAAPDVDKAKF
ncbi:hypothetical protein [Aeromonas schubertii]